MYTFLKSFLMISIITLLHCACAQEVAITKRAGNDVEAVRLVQLPPSESRPSDLSYFKSSIESEIKGKLATALPTAEVLTEEQRLNYYLNYEFRRDIKLVSNGDTLKPSIFFHEDMAIDTKSNKFFFAFDIPHDQEKQVLIEAPILSDQYAFEF